MAFAATMVWEVQSGGSDTANGGGFDPTSGTPGTDYSQQAAPQVSYTDLVIDGTTNTNITSAAHPFTSAHVGNVISITAGTGWTVQRLQVMSVAAGVATCDKSAGTLSSTGGTGGLGGALATPGAAGSIAIASNKIWIKSDGAYALSTATANVAGGRVSSPAGTAVSPCKWEGYQTTRGDKGTRPVIDDGGLGGGGVAVFQTNGTFVIFDNISVTGTNANNTGFAIVNQSCRTIRCKASGVLNGFDCSTATGSAFVFCEGATTTSTPFSIRSTTILLIGCVAHGSAVAGYTITNDYVRCVNCIAFGNTGAGFSGGAGNNVFFSNCTAYGNTGNGFSVSSSSTAPAQCAINCLSVGNGGYGFAAASSSGFFELINCATYNNTSGAKNNLTLTEGDIVLSGDPFVAVSTNFGLNNTAGAGAACRAAGIPGAFPGLAATNGYPDVGAVQHADTAASGRGALTVFLVGRAVI